MAVYTGNPCPVCGELFAAGDDIVVCPDCGTPYHRACWARAGHCVHESEHAAGFEWKPIAPPQPEAEPAAEAPADPYYGRAPQGSQPYDAPYGRRDPRVPRMEAYGAGPDGAIYRREVGPEDAIDGIKARDWASYVGRSSPYYLMQFFRMSMTHRRVTLSFSALLFGPAYFFYRKMWREGSFFMVLSIFLSMPSLFAQLGALGVGPFAMGEPSWLPFVLNFCYYGGWLANSIMCMFAVYWYKQTAARRIQEIYARVPEGPARADLLALSGGTSLSAAIICLAGTLLLSMFMTNLMLRGWSVF